MFRQGDVILIPVQQLPDGKSVARENGRIVLAHGEATGHAHTVAEINASLIEIETGERFLEIVRDAELVHDEHNTIALAPGIYKVGRQREYQPEAPRFVAD